MGRFLPQAKSHTRLLPRGTTGALRGRRLTGAMGYKPGYARGLVEFGPSRQSRVNHDAHPIESKRSLGDGSCKDDPASPLRIARNGRALSRRFHLSMQR